MTFFLACRIAALINFSIMVCCLILDPADRNLGAAIIVAILTGFTFLATEEKK